ncbi:hypothetical protein [Streptomyces sp. NPDC057438]|uniref:hypothetical protein n=1 Tax=Streptomyces sp. NPDC057438 TaxID=3346133 RepID=UPI003673E96F
MDEARMGLFMTHLQALLGKGTPLPEMSFKSVEQGAATSVLLAASPLLDGISGRYFEDCDEAPPHQPGTNTGVAPHALDPVVAERLWPLSEQLLD